MEHDDADIHLATILLRKWLGQTDWSCLEWTLDCRLYSTTNSKGSLASKKSIKGIQTLVSNPCKLENISKVIFKSGKCISYFKTSPPLNNFNARNSNVHDLQSICHQKPWKSSKSFQNQILLVIWVTRVRFGSRPDHLHLFWIEIHFVILLSLFVYEVWTISGGH